MEAYEIALHLIRADLRSGTALAAAKQHASLITHNAEAVDRAAAEIAREFNVIEELEPFPICSDTGSRWYTGPQATDVYWPAYRGRLGATGWTDPMLEVLDRTTTRVVSLLEAPGNAEIDTRGLVLGRVQSGKTANFTGVIAKAADCNYRLFIILSGTTNMLRLQTQKRVERDLTNAAPGKWYWLTRRDIAGDFGEITPENINLILGNKSVRTIAVVKKNGAVLRRLIEWIAGGTDIVKRDCPLLVIDDEADQASVPTGKSLTFDELTTINRRIVALLSVTPKIAYAGYTATPFANVLIDPQYEKNLYPRSFIYSLPTPPDYFGPERIFGRDPLKSVEGEPVSEGLPVIRTVPKEEIPSLRPMTKAAIQTFRFEVTPSLDEALRYFYMATAARLFRQEKSRVAMDFSTCLIHTSERILAHRRAKEAVEQHKAVCLEAVRKGQLSYWSSLWNKEMEAINRERIGSRLGKVEYDDLLPYLHQAIDLCKIIASNSDPNSETNVAFEEKGQIAIVIGGNTLARGLTLEGLIVSFFVRTASAYDTILQMGRWFGYRPFYEDLPRVWMTTEMQDDFYDLATVEEEFRTELERYKLGRTPLEVAVRIRRHPRMRITAANKMRWAIDCDTSYGGERPQTIYFKHKDEAWLKNNLDAACELVSAVDDSSAIRSQVNGRVIWKGISADLIKQFLNKYKFHEKSRDLDRDLIVGYIENQNKLGALTSWNVVVMGRGSGDERDTLYMGHGVKVRRVNRSRLKIGDANTANIKALMSQQDIMADQKDFSFGNMDAEEVFVERAKTSDGNAGLLLLYPISPVSTPMRGGPDSDRVPLEAVDEVIGVAMVFPAPHGGASAHDYVSAKVKPIIAPEDPEGDEDPEGAQ